MQKAGWASAPGWTAVENLSAHVYEEWSVIYTYIYLSIYLYRPIFIHCRSRWPRGLRRGSAAACLLGLRVRIPPGQWLYISCDCCVLEFSATGRSLVRRSPTECGASECDRDASTMRRPWHTRCSCTMKKKNSLIHPFLYLVVYAYIKLFIHPFVYLSCIQALMYSFIHSFIDIFIPASVLLFIHLWKI
jgi:hypothetical protein